MRTVKEVAPSWLILVGIIVALAGVNKIAFHSYQAYKLKGKFEREFSDIAPGTTLITITRIGGASSIWFNSNAVAIIQEGDTYRFYRKP